MHTHELLPVALDLTQFFERDGGDRVELDLVRLRDFPAHPIDLIAHPGRRCLHIASVLLRRNRDLDALGHHFVSKGGHLYQPGAVRRDLIHWACVDEVVRCRSRPGSLRLTTDFRA
jgi:hypothetical protein